MSEYDVAIVGGGLTGMGAAYRLVRNGKRVILVEKEKALGGLLGCHRVNDKFSIERYYHHVFEGDWHLWDLCAELEIEKELVGHKASVGYLIDGSFYRLDTPADIFLRFSPLSFWDKFRLGLAVIKIRRMSKDEMRRLDNATAKDWIVENCGDRVFDKFFRPLLGCKFGDNMDRCSAAWLCERIRIRSNRGRKGEILYYMNGSFQTLLNRWEGYLRKSGAEIRTGTPVERILVKNGKAAGIILKGGEEVAAKAVISTVSPQILLEIAPLEGEYADRLRKIRFQSSVCSVLGLRKSILNTYWLNIKSDEIPFGLMLEHTRFHREDTYEGHIVYMAGYAQGPEDPLWRMSESEIEAACYEVLEKQFGAGREDVLWYRASRAKDSAPVYSTGYLDNLPPIETPIESLYATGMMRSYPERSVNDSIARGFEVGDRLTG